MSTSAIITPLLLSLFIFNLAPSTAETVHDLLPTYGLPRGLLPDAVKSYSLSSNGDFVVELSSPCYVHFSKLVYYETTIKGKLSYGAISDLEGIQAKKLFIWVSVTGIVAKPSENQIEFQVGFFSESLSISEFQSIPTCESKVGCRGAAGVLGEGEDAPLALAEV